MEQSQNPLTIQLLITLIGVVVSILSAYFLFRINTEKMLQKLDSTKADKEKTSKMELEMAEKACRRDVEEIGKELVVIKTELEIVKDLITKVVDKLDSHISDEVTIGVSKRKRR